MFWRGIPFKCDSKAIKLEREDDTILLDFSNSKAAMDDILSKGRMLFYIDDGYFKESVSTSEKEKSGQEGNLNSARSNLETRIQSCGTVSDQAPITDSAAYPCPTISNKDTTEIEPRNKNVVTIIYSKNKVIFAKDPYKEIFELDKTVFSDLVCICQHFKPLTSTRGTDFLFSIILWDISGSIELKVFIKKSDFEQYYIPGTTEHYFKPGNVLLLRNVKKSSLETFAIIFKPNIITLVSDLDESPLKSKNFAELAIGNLILNRYRNEALDISIKSKKTVLIGDLKCKSFFNVIGKVISIEYGIVATVCITDFTVNSLAKDYKGTFPNNIVLTIKLFGQHAGLVDKISSGGYAFFENVRINSFSPLLVAYMHDSLEGGIVPLDDDKYLSELKKREAEFYANKEREDSETKRIKKNTNEDAKENDNNTDGSMFNKMATSGYPSDRNNSASTSALLPVKISDIAEPGTYLNKSLIKSIEANTIANDGTAVISTIEGQSTYHFSTKKNLSKKVFTNDKIKPESEYMCLVHVTPSGALYMIDIFTDDKEYEEFKVFYANSL